MHFKTSYVQSGGKIRSHQIGYVAGYIHGGWKQSVCHQCSLECVLCGLDAVP